MSVATEVHIPPACQVLDQSGPALQDIYLQDTSQSMTHIELAADTRQSIMQDQRKGINQKIIDLQNLQNANTGSGMGREQSR